MSVCSERAAHCACRDCRAVVLGPLGTLCEDCTEAGCDALYTPCRRPGADADADPPTVRAEFRDRFGVTLTVGDRVRSVGGCAVGVVVDLLEGRVLVRWQGTDDLEDARLLERLGPSRLDSDALAVRIDAIIAGWHAAKGRNPSSGRVLCILEDLARADAFTFDDGQAAEIAESHV